MFRKLLLPLLLAASFWFLMFFPYLGLNFNFWLVMSCASLTLTVLAIVLGGKPDIHVSWQELLLGVGIAVVLWFVFWTGDKVSQLLFDFARPQVDLIYGIKGGTPPTVIALLLLSSSDRVRKSFGVGTSSVVSLSAGRPM